MRSLADWLDQQQKSHPSAIDLDLTRVRSVAQRMGLVPPRYRVVTVAGTNGKGSTVAYLDALFRGAGKRTGRFTSPHLVRYNERICIDGVESRDEQLIASFERIDAARGATTLTFFEYNALAALDLFARAPVEVAVLEVGLGGRLDATNIVDADVGVVCSIGLDHVDWLGDSLEQIGREKAGIFRPGHPAVLGAAPMPKSVWKVIEEVGAHVVAPGQQYRARVHGDTWDFECGGLQLRDLPRPALAGEHQVGNAATALAAVVAGGFGVRLDHASVSAALRGVTVAGRFQRIVGEVEWILDVAHNVQAAETLRDNLRRLPRARRTLAVCGILGDKDIRGITARVAADVDAWILASLEGARAVSTQQIADALPPSASVLAQTKDVAEACRVARAAARPGDRVLVFGSFLTVGPALEFLGI
ncbi:MAG TPA: bifunctional tetrahydrofolate synthase/dihydrofolate synthase [Steroidobacteraceae bacterium]